MDRIRQSVNYCVSMIDYYKHMRNTKMERTFEGYLYKIIQPEIENRRVKGAQR